MKNGRKSDERVAQADFLVSLLYRKMAIAKMKRRKHVIKWRLTGGVLHGVEAKRK